MTTWEMYILATNLFINFSGFLIINNLVLKFANAPLNAFIVKIS